MRTHPSTHPLDILRERGLGLADARRIAFSERGVRLLRRVNGNSMGHNGCVNTVRFSPCGRTLLSGSDDGFVKVWDVASRLLLREVRTQHQHNIFHAELSLFRPNHVVTAAADGTIRLTDMGTGTEQVLLRSRSIVHMFATDLDTPSVLYSAEEIGCVQRIDLRTKSAEVIFKNLAEDAGGRLGLRCVKALAQSDALGAATLVVGGGGLTVGVLDLRVLALQQEARPADALFASVLSPLGATKSGSPAISPVRASMRNGVSVSGLALSKSGRRLAVSYQGDQIYLFDTCASLPSSGAIGPSNVLGGHVNHATCLKSVHFYGHRDQYILSGSDSAEMWVWDAASGALLPSASSYELLSGSGPTRLTVADRYACRVLNTLSADARTCNGAVPHPHLPLVASYGIDHTVKLWAAAEDSTGARGPRHLRREEQFVRGWGSLGPESTLLALPAALETATARLAFDQQSAKDRCRPRYSSRADCFADPFSFHRSVAGIRAELLSAWASSSAAYVASYPEDAGLVELVGEEGRAALRNTLGDVADAASGLLADLATDVCQFLGAETEAKGKRVPALAVEECLCRDAQPAVALGLLAVTARPSRVLAVAEAHGRTRAQLESSAFYEFFSPVFGLSLDADEQELAATAARINALASRVVAGAGGGEESQDGTVSTADVRAVLGQLYLLALLWRPETDAPPLPGGFEQGLAELLAVPAVSQVLARQQESIARSFASHEDAQRMVRLYRSAVAARNRGNELVKGKRHQLAVSAYKCALRYLRLLGECAGSPLMLVHVARYRHPALPANCASLVKDDWLNPRHSRHRQSRPPFSPTETVPVSDGRDMAECAQSRGDEGRVEEKEGRSLTGASGEVGWEEGRVDTPWQTISGGGVAVEGEVSSPHDGPPPLDMEEARLQSEDGDEGDEDRSRDWERDSDADAEDLYGGVDDDDESVDLGDVGSVGHAQDDDDDDDDYDDDYSQGESLPGLVESSDGSCAADSSVWTHSDEYTVFLSMVLPLVLSTMTPHLKRICYSNLATCFYSLGNDAMVVEVVDHACKLLPQSVSGDQRRGKSTDAKLLYRRGLAYKRMEDASLGLKDYSDASSSLSAALQLDPESAVIKSAYNDVRSLQEKARKIQASRISRMLG